MIGYKEIAQACSYLDAISEEGRPFDELVRDRHIDIQGLLDAAEQRALRMGVILDGGDPRKLSHNIRTRFDLSDKAREYVKPLQLAFIDGFMAGRDVCDPDDRIQRFPERED